MTAETILESPEFKKCSEFHGHICPGLSMGYQAAKAGMEKLREKRAQDEELVAIVETDACSADAVQVLTGCTFGKGNFIYRDHGKMVFTFLSRNSGQGVRVSLKPGAFEPDPEHRELLQKVMAGQADAKESQRFEALHLQRSREILQKPPEEIFDIQEVTLDLPETAQIAPSVPCERCGEPTMSTKMEAVEGQKLCRACAGG